MEQGTNWTIDASSGSRVFPHAQMPKRMAANGSESFDVVKGMLGTGELVSIHETVQPQGPAPNPAHPIQHTELICVSEGELAFTHDGKTERAKAGDILLVAKGTVHQLQNVGAGPARYTVVAIGGDAFKPATPATGGQK